MAERWKTTVTAFTVTRDGPLWLMLRHERLGVTCWELPGGHVDPGETLEQTAARETFEETGVRVEVGRLLASCVHEWHERRQRKLICFFEATAAADDAPAVPPSDARLVQAAWLNPFDVDDVSPFLLPLIDQERHNWADAPVYFQMTHRLNDLGHWEPLRMARKG